MKACVLKCLPNAALNLAYPFVRLSSLHNILLNI
jgi:hypothetical protein